MSFQWKCLKICAISCMAVAGISAQETAVGAPDLRTDGQEHAKPPAAATSATTTPSAPERIPSYVLGPDDRIQIQAFQVPELPNTPVQIAGDGSINLPLAGRVQAGGLTISGLEQELAARFSEYVRNPSVTVSIVEYRSQPVSVVGAVNNPGLIQLKGRKNLVEVIASAGGLRNDAGNEATITRAVAKGPLPVPDAKTDPSGKYYVARVKLHNVLEANSPQDNIIIEADDQIMIPKAPMLYVVGAVQKPGGYILSSRDTVTVLQAVALAGGLTPVASAKKAKIMHRNGDGSAPTELPTNVSKILSGEAPDVSLHRDDILFIPNSKSKSVGYKAAETAINMAGVAVWRF